MKRADAEWRKRPMTERQFLLFVSLGAVLLICGRVVLDSYVMAVSGLLIVGIAVYARLRTIRAERRE